MPCAVTSYVLRLDLAGFRAGSRGGRHAVSKVAKHAGWLAVLLLVVVPGTKAQVQVGDDLRMNMNGLINAGYSGDYGNEIASSHNLDYGGSAQLNGSYYNPNFLNFTVTPYYNQSRADSSFQSLTNSSGVDATANFFTGSHFPGYASYNYTRNSTGNFGLVGTPNFTTVGNGQGFGIGWSALLPNLPTFSAGYSQGSGTGTLFGTNEVSSSLTRTLNLRSSYHMAGWNLNAFYTHIVLETDFPVFLSEEQGKDKSNYTGNYLGVNG